MFYDVVLLSIYCKCIVNFGQINKSNHNSGNTISTTGKAIASVVTLPPRRERSIQRSFLKTSILQSDKKEQLVPWTTNGLHDDTRVALLSAFQLE